jgi:predicted CopG family antitoxin
MHAHACKMAPMRTTVEIDDAQRAELLKLAAQRGEKGFSSVIREALELYIRQHRAKREVVAQALKLKGSFSEDEADALETSVLQLREKWR